MAGINVANLLEMRGKVVDWADTDIVSASVIDDFINMAVDIASKQLRTRAFESTVSLPIIADKINIPSDYVQTKYLKVERDGYEYHLERKSLSDVDAMSSRLGIPCIFARDSGQFRMAPTPSSITTATLCYYSLPETLNNDTDTNWFITDASSAILFGALQRLGEYTYDETLAQSYKTRFETEIAIIQAVEDKAEWSGSTLSVKP